MRFQIESQFMIYVVEVYIIAQMNLLLNLILLFVFVYYIKLGMVGLT